MEKNKNFWMYPVLLTGMAIVLLNSCEKSGKDGKDEGSSGIVFNKNKTYGTVTDIDGNVYKTIVIGSQTWMAENLKTTRYSGGDSINHLPDGEAWNAATAGAWIYYNNNNKMNGAYGKLYNWLAVEDPRNICPAGWHIPDDAEWETLFNSLGGYEVAAAKLKETGTTHWAYSNEGSTNESGFTGLPGGMRWGDYFDLGLTGFWWSSTDAQDYYNLDAYYIYFNRDLDAVSYGTGSKTNGISCRCVMN